MSKQYVVLERSFINGRLYEPGETVVLEINEPGSNLKLASNKNVAAPASGEGGETNTGDVYVAARGAAGKFVVKDATGGVAGTFVGNKAEAEAEAARLNAGGLPLGETNTGGVTEPGGTTLPDA
ncbi:hypothetical protein [Pseudomonas fluorescens]|uniref:hypothetical protein n=1 Tax=Pseudomonas fluorescens TaxID=294 RepID=UPI000641B8E1|nr:hypothetical protein [Pseudomonas fluorescens]